MSYPCFADLSRSFAPGWFAAVMGTGVFALTTHSLAAAWRLLIRDTVPHDARCGQRGHFPAASVSAA